ncbi:putative ribonuclease H-like domain-containing protein, partial [Tanacetum coccineum]
EKTKKKNDVKARGLLLMALPNEHQLTFSQYPDAKSMFAAIETRFGGNAATKKTLLKQQYENFSATSTESLDFIFNRLQKIVSRLAILGCPVDNTVYAFMVENPNGSNVLHQDLKQIHEDDLEAIDLKWQLSLLSVRAKKYYQRTYKKIFINGNDIVGYDKSKVECYNCHKFGHFAKECRAPRSKEGQFRNQDNTRKQGNNEDTSKAMLAIDGVDNSKENSDKSLVKEQTKPEKKTVIPTAAKIEKPVKKSVRYAEMYRSQSPRGNQRNWNGQKSNQLGSEFVYNKACFICEGFNHVQKNWYFPSKRNRGPIVVNTTRPNRTSVNAARANGFNAVKPSTCWVWRPIKHNSASITLNRYNYIDARGRSNGCSRHMTGNIAYLSDFKQFDGGYVAFGGGAYGGKISGKGTLKTNNLDFKDGSNTDDYSRFTWVFFLTTKDETSEILKRFIKEIENLVDKKVKIIRSDNRTEFKNKVMDDFCREKGIKREYSVARTPQQNGIAERRNRTLIEAARTMLADSKLPITFWAKVVYLLLFMYKTSLGKFDGKSDEGFFVGYSLSSKAFRVYNTRTKRVEENLHIRFLENKPMIEGTGPKWLFDIDSLTQSMNYVPVTANVDNGEPKTADDAQKQVEDGLNNENVEQERFADDSSSKDVNAAGQQVNTASLNVNTGSLKLNDVGPSVSTASPNVEDSTEEEPKVNLGNITNSYTVPTTPNTRIHKDHPIDNVIGEVLSTIEPTSIAKALSDSSWVEAMQEELLQFKLQQVWILVDLPNGKKAIGTKWVFRNKKDERGIVIRNKARLVEQGHRQEEGIDYEEVFAPMARIKAIRLFLAYASFMGFLVYQMDVKSAFLYGTIEEEVYVTQPLGFKDPGHLDKVYKVVKALYGLHQAPRACSMGELTFFLGLQVQQKEDGIFISQDKYVAEILKKFNYSDVKSASTPVDLEKPLVKDGDADDVDVHLYRSMIGSLMYLTASRPDIMFAVCACARFQVTPKTLHLLAVKRIFRYLKGKPTLGLWYSRDSPFELVAYTDSDYAGATLDRKSTTGGCISQEAGTPRYLSLVVPLTKVGDEDVHKELGDRMERASATTSSLEVEQDNGSGPRCQDTILGDVNAQTSPKFAETHNVVAFLEKPKESDGFAEIIDFLKTVNGVRQIQALVDKKRVVVTESSIRRDLHLDDAEGTDCLPTATIFEELARMGYEKPSQKLTFYKAFFSPQWKYFIHTITQCLSAKSTAWNEFSSSMASLIICLATNQKFNLSKYIFDAMVKHLDGGVKFLLYPRFLQVFINQQLGNMSTHKKIFVNPFHTKKVFANMKRAGKDFSGRITPLFDTMMVQPVEEMGEDSDNPTDSTPIPIIDQPSSSSQPKKDKLSKKVQRQEAEVPQDEAEHEESLPTPSSDPQPSGEDSMKLTDLMVLCTKLQTQVLDLQKAKDAQAKEIDALKKRIQRLERRKISRPTGLKRLRKVGMSRRVESSADQERLGVPEDASKQGRSIEDIDADIDVSLVDETQERQDDDLMFDTGILDDVEMPVEAKVDGKDEQSTKKLDDSTAGEAVTTADDDSVVPTTNEEITLAQTLIQIKAAKPKVVTTADTTTTTTRPKDKGVVVQEPSEFRVPQEIKPSSSKDKGKGIMIEPEVPLKRKDQIALDEQIARDIQAKLDAELLEEQKLARKQEEEANIALIESWENTQAMMEADRLLAERLQSKEREELTDEEKAKLFMELMEKRRKHFAALRAQEKRNRPPTKAQKRTQMSTYLKHMGGYTYKQLKGKSFDEIQKLFDKEMKRVNTFVAMGSEVQENKEKKEEGREETAKGSRKKMLGRKRAVKEQQEESSKKQKVEEEKESEEVEEDDEVELKKLLVIKKDEDIAIDAIPLATKLPVIIDYKLHKEGMMVHYQLIRADGSSKRYSSMIRMLQGIDKEDLEALWRIVKEKYGDTRPDNEFERVLWGDLKVMFEPDKSAAGGWNTTVRRLSMSRE